MTLRFPQRLTLGLFLMTASGLILTGFAMPEPRFVSIAGVDWMAQNVDTSTFQNGEPIPKIDNGAAWARAGQNGRPATASYPNAQQKLGNWGRLYNYAAISDPRGICPQGWRVPDDRDWNALERALGVGRAASRLRSSSGWPAATRSVNDVGFAAPPAGFRTQSGDYFLGDRVAYFWSLTSVSAKETTAHMLFDYDDKIFRIGYDKSMGMSLRCVRRSSGGS